MPGSHLHTLEPDDKTKDLGVTAVSSDREVSTSFIEIHPYVGETSAAESVCISI